MGTRSSGGRVKINVAVRADLVRAVDAFLAENPGMDRSAVVEQALLSWCSDRQERAMAEQFAEPLSEEVEAELQDWRNLRRAAAERTFGHRNTYFLRRSAGSYEDPRRGGYGRARA
jgi:hypothetical protein